MILDFNPPCLNSSGPWATTKEDLRTFYTSPHTGAVTTRTSTLRGFSHDAEIHAWGYYDARSNAPLPERSPNANSTINSLGYSPRPLDDVLLDVQDIAAGGTGANTATGVKGQANANRHARKPFIISVTGTAEEIDVCYEKVHRRKQETGLDLLLEVNLSCPNIHGKPPPAYDQDALKQYLTVLHRAYNRFSAQNGASIPVGIKVPPYTYIGQFEALIAGLLQTTSAPTAQSSCIAFITSTNTLGNCLVLAPTSSAPIPLRSSTTPSKTQSASAAATAAASTAPAYRPTITSESGTGHGGIGGVAIHPVSLGNVATLRRLLDAHAPLKKIEVLGTGGVNDWEGVERMRSVGAAAVGIGTAVGKEGVDVFHKIAVERNF